MIMKEQLLLMKVESQRLIMFIFTVIFFTIGANAEDETTLIVWPKNGSPIGYALTKKPVLTFTETEMKIYGEGIEAVYDLDNLDKYTYSNGNDTGLRDMRTDEVVARFDGESMLFLSLKAHSTVSVYTPNGEQVFRKTIHSDGEYSFPLSALNAGAFIVNVNGITYKILKK